MNTKDLVYVALFAAIIASLGIFPPITVPLIGVPITAQSMGPMLAGAIIGAKRAGLATVVFLALVALGVPLLSGGRSGLGVFLGPSGGFLLGFIPAAIIVGALVQCPKASKTFGAILASCIIGGIVIMYSIGILWLVIVAGVDFAKAVQGSAAFIPGDLIKAIIAAGAATMVRKVYPGIAKAAA